MGIALIPSLKERIDLDELKDVEVPAPADGEAPTWNDAVGLWTASAVMSKLEDDKTPKLGGDFDGDTKKIKNIAAVAFTDFTSVTLTSPTDPTSPNTLNITQTCHEIDTYGDAATQDLETIAGGAGVQLLFIHSASAARVITIKHAADNVILQGKTNIVLDDVTIGLFLMRIETVIKTIWVDVTKLAPSVGWELVESKILTSDVGSVSFDELSSDYNAFRLTCMTKRSLMTGSVAIRFNDDSGANYECIEIIANRNAVTGLSQYSDAQSYPHTSSPAPTEWTDLDTGAGPSMVALEVYNQDAADPVDVWFRDNRRTGDYQTNAGGAGALIGLEAGKRGGVIVTTDSDGLCEWKASAANTMSVRVLGKTLPATKNLAEVEYFTGQIYGVIGIYDQTHFGLAFVYIQNRLAGVEKEYMSFAGLGSENFRNITGRWNNTTDLISKITLDALIGNLLTGSQFILEGARGSA